jgi:hypothetical protein
LTLAAVSALDIQALYRELLNQNLSARSIRYTHAMLRSALKQACAVEPHIHEPSGFG